MTLARFDMNEEAFEEHFGVPYGDFATAVSSLSPRDLDQYGRTYEANPEAAILWAIKVCKEHGILEED